MNYIGDLYAKIGRKYLKLDMTSTDVDNLIAENEKLKKLIENNKQGYKSVKDTLPPSDGKHYEVMCIVFQDNISASYSYVRGQYNNGGFHIDHSFYWQDKDFRNDDTQLKVIAWKPLHKCTTEQVRGFLRKVGV